MPEDSNLKKIKLLESRVKDLVKEKQDVSKDYSDLEKEVVNLNLKLKNAIKVNNDLGKKIKKFEISTNGNNIFSLISKEDLNIT